MTTLQTAIKQATRHILRSDRARTVDGYIMHLKLERFNNENRDWLIITDWGFDDDGIAVPKNRPELIRQKCAAQMAGPNDRVAQIALRFYLDILRRADIVK